MLTDQKSSLSTNTKSKRKVDRYQTNPFFGGTVANTKQGMKRIYDKSGTKMMVVSGSGEIMAPAGFWQAEEVDRAQFLKLYTNGVKAFRGLSNSGARVFEIYCMRVQAATGKDQILLSYPSIDQDVTPLSESTFYRGMREMIDKEFLAESTVPGVYFINPDYIFNGDRLAFVKEYRAKGSKAVDPRQIDIPFDLDPPTE